MDAKGRSVIVCDNGSGFIKCGFAGIKYPKYRFPTLVGRPIIRSDKRINNIEIKDIMIGNEALKVKSVLEFNHPIKNGMIQNWEDMTHLWEYAFGSENLNIDHGNSKILLTEPLANTQRGKEKILEVMLETFQFDSCCISNPATLTLFSQGLSTGVVVDSGETSTNICPVYDGYGLSHLTKSLKIAGNEITRYLIKLLSVKGYALNTTADFETVRIMKEKLCYVGYDMDVENRLAHETTCLTKSYTLPDARTIKVDCELYQAPEALFQPHLVNIESKGLAELVFSTIQNADIDLRKELYKHIVLSGGSTMFAGLSSRLEREIKQLYLERVLKGNTDSLSKFKLRVEDQPYRKDIVFMGGSMLANVMKDRDDFWISKSEYQEQGSAVLNSFGAK